MMKKTEILHETARCIQCYDSPCQNACPASIRVPSFIRMIKSGNLKGAAQVVYEDNPLGGICGYVCPSESFCEKDCSRAKIDSPIKIRELHKFATDNFRQALLLENLGKQTKNGKRVAIIGSGPAGLACAVELRRAGVDVTIFEEREEPGGVLRYGIPPFRLPKNTLYREINDIKEMGVIIKTGHQIGENGVDKLLKEGYKAVFIATGLWSPLSLNIPGWNLDGVMTATDFLFLVANGKDQDVKRLVRGKNIAIVGGGSVAMDVAVSAKKYGAERVYAICLESLKELPAKKEDFHCALEHSVVIKPQAMIKEIKGYRGKVKSILGVETEWIKPNLLIPSNAKEIPGTEFSLKVDLVIFAIGNKAKDLKISSNLEYDRKGGIKLKSDGISTSDPRIFVGGDLSRKGGGSVVEAVRDGKLAAKKIINKIIK